jgi:uncharacterized protein (TIGR02598 family)
MRNSFGETKRDIGGFAGAIRPRAALNSFTLVEVVIAIAVTAFVLISILGLMSYASQMVQQSDKYARLSAVTSQVVATLGSQPFILNQAQAQTNAVFYYTFDGLPTNSAAAYYQCNITNASPSTLALTNAAGKYLMEPIQVMIRWPKPSSITVPFANTNIIVTSILQYD